MEPSDILTVTLPVSQWLVVGEGLAELPYKKAHPVIAAIDKQLNDSAKGDKPDEE